MKIEKDNMYQEGYWAGRSVAENIEKTTYKDLKTLNALWDNNPPWKVWA